MLLRRHRGDSDGERQAEQGNQEGQEAQAEQKVLEDYTVSELKDMAQEKEIEGYSNMKKAELIEALEG